MPRRRREDGLGDAIGDKDLRILQEHYLSGRPEKLPAAFETLDANRNGIGNGAEMDTTQSL